MSAPKRGDRALLDQITRRMMQLATIGPDQTGIDALTTVCAQFLASRQATEQDVLRFFDLIRRRMAQQSDEERAA